MDKILDFIYKILGYLKKGLNSKKVQKAMQKNIKNGLQKVIKVSRK